VTAVPDPQPFGEWRSDADRHGDVVGIVVAACEGDESAARWVLESLNRSQLVEVCWLVSLWFCWAVRGDKIDDPTGFIRHAAWRIRGTEGDGGT
jgi:hypothetical protein